MSVFDFIPTLFCPIQLRARPSESVEHPYYLTSWVLRVANSLLSVTKFLATKPIFGVPLESLEVFLADFQGNGK
jgi:hypothetical protein